MFVLVLTPQPPSQSNNHQTEMAKTSPSSFAQPNTFANVLSLDVEVGPDSDNDA